VSIRLDPDEALAGPLYAVAAMLLIVPLTDFVLSVPPAQFSSVQWRFATAGLFSGYTVQPILGLALAFVVTAAFGAVYFAAAHSLRIDEAHAFMGALVRRLRRA